MRITGFQKVKCHRRPVRSKRAPADSGLLTERRFGHTILPLGETSSCDEDTQCKGVQSVKLSIM